MTGTLVNTAAIITGSLIGVLVRSRLPRGLTQAMLQVVGLVVLVLGISLCLKGANLLAAIVSVVAGTALGYWMRLGQRLDNWCHTLQDGLKKRYRKAGPDGVASPREYTGFTEGFLTASMIFCVGSMSILGAIEDGMGQTPTLLYTKSVMDGITSVVLASSMGIAVIFSSVPVLIYQGLLTILAFYAFSFMTEQMIADLSCVGGIMLLAMGFNLLKIIHIEVMNMLPGLLLVIVLSPITG